MSQNNFSEKKTRSLFLSIFRKSNKKQNFDETIRQRKCANINSMPRASYNNNTFKYILRSGRREVVRLANENENLIEKII